MFWTGKGPPPEALVRHLADPVNAARVDEISDADRDWFLAHPGRRCRLRPIRRGESPPGYGDVSNHVIVLQLQPGFRVRCSVVLRDLIPEDDVMLYHTAIKLLQQEPAQWRAIKKMAREIARRAHAAAK
jgi:hypothetical protein